MRHRLVLVLTKVECGSVVLVGLEILLLTDHPVHGQGNGSIYLVVRAIVHQ